MIKELMPDSGWIAGKTQAGNEYFSDGCFMAVGEPPGKVRYYNPLAVNTERYLKGLRYTRLLGTSPDERCDKRMLAWFDDLEAFNYRYILGLQEFFGATDWFAPADRKARVLVKDGKPVAIVMGMDGDFGPPPRSISRHLRRRRQ